MFVEVRVQERTLNLFAAEGLVDGKSRNVT